MVKLANETTSVQIFEELLAGSVAAHGHLCPGQIVGVRMAMLGLRLLDFHIHLKAENYRPLPAPPELKFPW